MGSSAPGEMEVVTDHRRAAALLSPLRLRILHEAGQPVSASELGSRLGLPRQRVNHHFRRLIRAGLLRPAGKRRRRNLYEKLYVASARGYLISPAILGVARADWRRMGENRTFSYLLALLADVQLDLVRLLGPPDRARPEPVSLKTQVWLESGDQRDELERGLRDAVAGAVGRWARPPAGEANARTGGAYRLVLACYPYEPESRDGAAAQAPSGI